MRVDRLVPFTHCLYLCFFCVFVLLQSALSGLHRMKQSVSVSRDKLQIIKMDIVGVTRPEAVTETQAMMPGRAMPAMAKFSSDVMATSPIEGDQKMVTATIIIKIRF